MNEHLGFYFPVTYSTLTFDTLSLDIMEEASSRRLSQCSGIDLRFVRMGTVMGAP